MPTLSIEIPDELLHFLEKWTQAQGTTIEAWIIQSVRLLRESATQEVVHPHVKAVVGILPDDGKDYKAYREEYIDYLEKKYR